MSTRDRIAGMAPLLAQLEGGAAPAAREWARALAHELLEAHRGGLARLLDCIRALPDGEAVLLRLSADADIAALLMLHGLHPVSLPERVRQAAAALAPRLAAQHARLELLGVDANGTVRLRVEHAGKPGAMHGVIEEAFAAAAADASEIHITEAIVVPVSTAALRRGAGA